MEKITDLEICEMIGMSPQNLRASYKKSPNANKRLMYEALKIGLIELRRREADNSLHCTCDNCGLTNVIDASKS